VFNYMFKEKIFIIPVTFDTIFFEHVEYYEQRRFPMEAWQVEPTVHVDAYTVENWRKELQATLDY
jgi:hypothetical protein